MSLLISPENKKNPQDSSPAAAFNFKSYNIFPPLLPYAENFPQKGKLKEEKDLREGITFPARIFSKSLLCLMTHCFQQFFTFVLCDLFTTFFSEVSHFKFLFYKKCFSGKIVLLM
jgi:hypothetical protein